MNAVREIMYQPGQATKFSGAELSLSSPAVANNDNSIGLVQQQPQQNKGMNIQSNVADDAAVSFGADILFGGGIASALSMTHNVVQGYDDFQKEQIKVSFSRSELDKKPSLSEVNASSIYQITPNDPSKNRYSFG